MEMKQFAENVLAVVREKADGKFSAWVIEREKNNGVMLTGITTKSPACSIEPCIYLDDYYKAFRSGEISVDEAADTIYNNIMDHKKQIPDINVKDFLQWDSIKGFIYPKIINEEMNRSQLAEMPHRSFLDLAVVYYVKVMEDRNGVGTILIHSEHMKLWGQDENVLYEVSLNNMNESGDMLFEDILNFVPQCLLFDRTEQIPDNFKMYVLTNRSKCFGAARILDSVLVEKINQQIGDFIVLPSSIHEVIIMPNPRNTDDYCGLAAMVREINNQTVNPDERLSDHVYTYSRQNGELKLAA